MKYVAYCCLALFGVACGAPAEGGSGGASTGETSGSAVGSGSSGSPESGSSSGGGGSSGSAGGTGSASGASGESTSGAGASGESSGSGSTSGASGDDGGANSEAGSGGMSGSSTPTGSVNVYTNRYDDARTGANPHETILTPSNVRPGMFGLLFTDSIEGQVYNEPLYVSGLTINGAAHNVVYVATAHNMVYAFDADSKGPPLWSKQVDPPDLANAYIGCGDMVQNASQGSPGDDEVGITSTPVIDPAQGKIFVLAKTGMGKTATQHLHALDLATGAEAAGSPASVGTGTANFDPAAHMNRPGLLLLNGTIYIGFGSHCDYGTYHGWIFGVDAHTFMPVGTAFNTTPSGSKGAIWQSGMGLSTDGTSIWFDVGNGSSNAPNLSMNIGKVTPSASGFALGPHHLMPPEGDNDLEAGPVLVGNQVLAGGKSGYIVLLNQSDATLVSNETIGGEVHNMATWNGGSAGQFVYTWGSGTPLHALTLTNSGLMPQVTNTEQSPGHPGGMITVSSNGTTASTGIVWGLLPLCGNAWKTFCAGALYAWEATDVSKMSLWNSTVDAADALGSYAKYSTPTVANGKVYALAWPPKGSAAGTPGALAVYGLKN
jgi:hypothetical protein